jgi:hypothetical protein
VLSHQGLRRSGRLFATALGIYHYGFHAGQSISRDGSSLVLGRDFLNFWMYGRTSALPDPSAWYDAAT